MVKRIFFVLFLSTVIYSNNFNLELNPLHLKYATHSNDDLLEKCREDKSSPVETNISLCWGFEKTCSKENSYSSELGVPMCEKGKEAAKDTFWKQADWGYVRERADLFPICTSENENGTSLVCSKQLQHCYAKNIFFDFRHFKAKGSKRYRNDIILEGDVGGNCQKSFEDALLKDNLLQKSYLQSWGYELEHFSSVPLFEVNKENCDVIFDGPTILQKQDASVNMFHHFCDFVNLYVSQHINGSFSRDVQIIWWDTAESGFGDTMFGVTWKAFSRTKPLELLSLAGKRVCFKEVMLPLLARQPFGLFYNMPLIQGCSSSGLMHAFAHHVLHRLDIPESVPDLETVRVTILSRSTHHRKILNIGEIEQAVRSLPSVRLRIVDYNHQLPFLEQLKTTHSSDVFIGMHGAGLTHLLFLPDWAAVFEIYHCEDRGCYRDLTRVRGVKYFTWPDQKLHLIKSDNTEETREKFVNYSFDVDEFKSQVLKMVEWVRRHPKFIDARRKERRRLKKLEL